MMPASGCITPAFHLRAVCPEGAGRSAVARSATAVKCDGFLEHRARQVQTLVLPRLSWPRRRPAPPALRPSRDRCGFAAHRPQKSTRRAEIATVLRIAALDRRPSWRAELSCLDGQKTVLALSTSGRAKRVELTPVRRQNAAFTCRRFLEGGRQPAFAVALQGDQTR